MVQNGIFIIAESYHRYGTYFVCSVTDDILEVLPENELHTIESRLSAILNGPNSNMTIGGFNFENAGLEGATIRFLSISLAMTESLQKFLEISGVSLEEENHEGIDNGDNSNEEEEEET